jgi:hypothetical protein
MVDRCGGAAGLGTVFGPAINHPTIQIFIRGWMDG